MVKRTVVCLAVLVLASVTALAASKNGIITSANGRKTIAVNGPSKSGTPYVEHEAATAIVNNLSKYPNGVYWCCTGATISGPSSVIGVEYWEAAGFTPSSNVSVTKIKVGIGWVTGTNSIVLSLNSDSGGVPGAALKTWHIKNMPGFGTCCTVEVKTAKAGIPLTGGSQYWVVASTDSKDTDVWGAWNYNDTDQVNAVPTAYYYNGAWTSYLGYPGYAMAVYGQ